MDKKKYATPSLKLVNIQTCGMLATSLEDSIDMDWSGDKSGTAGPDEIDDYSTFDSF
jgi:hypothetical protein